MNLSVLMPKKISKEAEECLGRYLVDSGFRKEESAYSFQGDDITLDVILWQEPENDPFWLWGAVEVVWFVPMTEIEIVSRDHDASHRENYHLAKELAGIVRGVIYDHQINVIYTRDGEPVDIIAVDRTLPEYGMGLELFREKWSE